MGPLIQWNTLCFTTERLWSKGFNISKYQRSSINEFANFQDCIKGFSSENRFCKDTLPPKVFNFPLNERPKLFSPAMSMVFLCISAPTVVASNPNPPSSPSSSPSSFFSWFYACEEERRKEGKRTCAFYEFSPLEIYAKSRCVSDREPQQKKPFPRNGEIFFLHLVLIVFLGVMWKCATYHIFFSTVGK